MEDVYALRYRCDDKDVLKSFVFFPDDSPSYPVIKDSYALEVYKDLGRIADSAATILTRQAESQMMICTGRGQLTIHKRTWAYLKSKLNVEAHPVDLTTFRKRTLSGIETAGYSQLRKCEYLRLETEADMDNLVKTLGPTSILGNRVKRPKLDIPFAPGTRSIMNQVVGNFERDNWKRRTTNRGFDICSDGDIARMYVRYERHILGSELSVPSNQMNACLQYKMLLVGDEEDDEERDERDKEPVEHYVFTHGTQFEFQDEIFKLFSILLERICAVPVGNTTEVNAIYFISAEERLQLEELIDNYN
jgi:hypothetical protein